MRGTTRLKRTIRNIGRLAKPVAVILIYHRVIELPIDEYRLAVSPKNFAHHLKIIREKYTPISLSGLADGLINGHPLPRRSVAITFDDGYADNYRFAWPLLEACPVPATIFVTSGQVNSPREFWWDDLERILLSAERLPELLCLRLQGGTRSWPTATADQRRTAFKEIHQLLRPLAGQERRRILEELADWAGCGQAGRAENLALKTDELARLSRSQWVEIGAHTQTHPVLSAQSAQVQFSEIVESRKELAALLGKPIRTFAYPFGHAEDFTPETVEIVKAAGFTAAVTTTPGAVTAGDDLFRLKRWEVNNWDADQFQRKLASFFYA